MRDIGSHAPHLQVMRGPKALGSRRSGRAGEPAAGGVGAGVGKPCRCPASPAASLLPAPWPDASPARSLWVIIKDLWYKSQCRDQVFGHVRLAVLGVDRRAGAAGENRSRSRVAPGQGDEGGQAVGSGAELGPWRLALF